MKKTKAEYFPPAVKSIDIMAIVHQMDIQNTVETILSQEGYLTRFVSDIESAIEEIKTNPPDLILLEDFFSEENSIEFNKRLKSDTLINDIPIIFIIDSGSKNILTKYSGAGRIDFIYGPLRQEELSLRIKTLLERSDSSQTERKDKQPTESEERFRAIFNNNPIPTYLWQCIKNDFVLQDYNGAAIKFTKGKIKTLDGIKATDLYKVENQQVLEDFRYCFEHKTSIQQEIYYQMKTSDQVVYLNAKYTYIHPNMVMVQTEDFTERRQVEIKLKQSTDLLEVSQRIAKVGGWELDIATNKLFWTAETYRIHDTSPSEFTPSLDIGIANCLPESRQIISEALKLAIEDGESYDLELEKYTLKGRHIYVRTTCTVTFDDGKPVKLTGIIQDITKQKLTEKELIESQEKFSKAFDNNPVPSAILNIKTGERLAVNKAYCKVYDYSKSELLSGLKHNIAADQQEYDNIVKHLLRDGAVHNFPFRMLTKSGEIRDTLVNATKLYPDNDHVFITSNLDVTDRNIALEELKKSEQHLRAIVENSLNAIIVADDSGNYTSANPAALDMFGYTHEQLLNMNVSQINMNPGENALDRYNQYLEKGMEIGELEFIRSDNQQRVALYHAVRVRENFNLSILSDITKSKKAELELNETLQQLNLAINTAKLGIWVLTLETEVNDWNDQMLEIYGLSREEFEADLDGWRELVHPEDKAYADSRLMEAFEKKPVFDVHFRIIRPNGEIRYLEASASPILDKNGELIKIIGINFDVTDRKLAVKKLEESQQKFKTLFEHAVDIVSLVDKDGNIIDMNRTDPVYTKEEVIGSNIKNWLTEDQRSKYTELANKASETGEVQSFEPIIEDPTGKKRHWHYRISSVEQNTSKEKLIVTFSEVTEQKKAEAELREYRLSLEEKVKLRTAELQVAYAQLQKAQQEIKAALEKEKELGELKSRFIATASHQFRTPLTVIRSNTELMEDSVSAINEEKKYLFNKAFNRIKNETNRMTDIMNDILILGKINAGVTKSTQELVNIVDIAQDMVERLNEVDRVKAKIRIKVINKPRSILIDENQFIHILVNILSNAQKYSVGRGDVDLNIYFKESKVELVVKDKGIGISEDDLKNLFQPFFRGTNTEGIQGTGLGLSIAHEYMQLNKGEIKISSEIEVGTTVELIFHQ